MAAAQGISKTISFGKQSALGTSQLTAQYLRRRSSSGGIFTLDTATFENDEVVPHRQSTGVTYGTGMTKGKMSCLLSPLSYSLFMASMMRANFATVITTTALTNVTAAVGPITFTRAAGSYLTDGFKLYDTVLWTGWATTGTANNSRNFFITSLTALVMGGVFLDATAGGAKASGDTVTCVQAGKKSTAAISSHTTDYFTVENGYTDLGKYELFPDCVVGGMDFSASGNANIGLGFDFMGLSRARNTSAQQTASAATTTGVCGSASLNSALYIGTTKIATLTGLQFKIDPQIATMGPVIFSATAPDITRGRLKISGTLQAIFDGTTLQALYDTQTVFALAAVCLNDATANGNFVSFVMPRCKFTGDAPDDNEKEVVRSYPFVCEIDSAGGAALATPNSIMYIQDSQAL